MVSVKKSCAILAEAKGGLGNCYLPVTVPMIQF